MSSAKLKFPIYMDYQATTPVDERVLEEMLPWFSEKFGNAASTGHVFGEEAAAAVKTATRQIAGILNAEEKGIIYTSGATESINLALKGISAAFYGRRMHIISVATEHKAVLDCLKYLQGQGVEITILPVGSDGLISPRDLEKAIRPYTCLVSVMMVNNEIGVLAPMEEIGAITEEKDILLHSDATQAVGKIPVDIKKMNIDLLSCSGHKIYGPKGIGILYLSRRARHIPIGPQIHGGGHQRGLRSGTLNVPAIVGMGKACEIAQKEMKKEAERLLKLRNRLFVAITRELDQVQVNGSLERRIPGNLNLSFEGVDGESILLAMREIALSSGSACTTAAIEPSHVIRALGFGDERGHSAIRFGLGRFTTEAEVDYVAKKIIKTVGRLRGLLP